MKKFDFRNKAEGRYGYGDNVIFIKITMSNQYSENIKDRKEMLTKLNKEIDELRKQDTKVNRSNYSNIKEYMEDVIALSGEKYGEDWNFDQHIKISSIPSIRDFKKTVANYLSWEVSQLLKNKEEDSSKKV